MSLRHLARVLPIALPLAGSLQAAPFLAAIGTLDQANDSSGLVGNLENGNAKSILGGIGSGLAWAGGNTFLALPDRGPNAVGYKGGSPVDNTDSYIARFHTLSLDLTPVPNGGLSATLAPTLRSTTLLYSPTTLAYGAATDSLPAGAPSENTADHFYFTGRSDNFGPGTSANAEDARLDPEGIRLSADYRSVFVSDEYGPYVYQFDRATGKRLRSFKLPDHFYVANKSGNGATEISGNTSGRVANKGMEGLAISPDGSTLIGFAQSPLIQDGGDGGRANRIVTIDIASGATHEYAYDNFIGGTVNKAFNSSEILALNSKQFLVLERDGKGLGDGSKAVIKRLYAVDITHADDVSDLSGEAALVAKAPAKTLFLDIFAVLNGAGLAATQIPAKLEGAAFGNDIVLNDPAHGHVGPYHTLYIANDNDFVPDVAGPSKFFAFAFTDADLASGFALQPQSFDHIPDADAGVNVTITTSQAAATVITGAASDSDAADVLSYRWVEGANVLKDWAPVPAGGECPLALAGLGLGIGQHTLTLEVSDGRFQGSNDMLLVIGNSAPTAAPSGAGTYELGSSVSLGGTVADFDGDNLHYSWSVDGQPACSGDVATPAGGGLAALPACVESGLGLGDHVATLTVTDGVNAPVSASVALGVVDDSSPTLAPVAAPNLLWPPDGRMVPVTIATGAADNSGSVNLSVSVSSDEAPSAQGDWDSIAADPSTGLVTLRLRADRSGKGNGRAYSMVITATDPSGNASSATVQVKVPHDQARK